jgi:glycerophosphoryl diester phosphodiesterase
MIEFDVRARRGRLLVAHTFLDARRPGCLSLDRALAHLATPRFGDVALDVDLKQPGAEAAVLEALRHFGLLNRSLISSQCARALDRVRELEPAARTAVSVGGRLARRRQRWRDWRAAVVEAVRARRFDDLMAQHGLVDGELVEAVRAAGGQVYAWTVDSAQAMHRLAGLGVAGIASNDPRLFATGLRPAP